MKKCVERCSLFNGHVYTTTIEEELKNQELLEWSEESIKVIYGLVPFELLYEIFKYIVPDLTYDKCIDLVYCKERYKSLEFKRNNNYYFVENGPMFINTKEEKLSIDVCNERIRERDLITFVPYGIIHLETPTKNTGVSDIEYQNLVNERDDFDLLMGNYEYAVTFNPTRRVARRKE
jgi:hypothetical protein